MNRDDLNESAYSLSGLIQLIGLNFKFLFICTGLFSLFSLIYAVSLDDIYTSEALLSPVKSIQDTQPKISGGNIGSLIGLGGPSGSGDKTMLALQVLETKDFFKALYQQDTFLAELSASESYEKETDTLIFDKSKYLQGVWLEGKKPNLQKAHRDFMDLVSVEHDRLDGFVRIKVDHISPYVAKKWLERLIIQLNQHIKLKEVLQAQKSVDYLQEQILLRNKVDLNMIFSSMLVKQYETIMLSEITDEFVFEVLDEPRVPDRKSKPSRAFIAIFLSLSGAFLFLLLVLFLNASGRYIELTFIPPRINTRRISD